MTLGNKSIPDPELSDALIALKLDIFRSLRCVMVGQIVSFDKAKKTAKIKIMIKRVLPNGNPASYPTLVDCPVFTLQGGGGGIQFPIAAGDDCVVIFSDRNIDAWFKTGSEAAPFNARCHDLSDGIALVGINALNSPLQNYVSSKARFFYSGAEIDLSGGIVTIKNGTTTLLTLLDAFIDVLATLQVSGPLPLTPDSITALQAFKLQLAVLLG